MSLFCGAALECCGAFVPLRRPSPRSTVATSRQVQPCTPHESRAVAASGLRVSRVAGRGGGRSQLIPLAMAPRPGGLACVLLSPKTSGFFERDGHTNILLRYLIFFVVALAPSISILLMISYLCLTKPRGVLRAAMLSKLQGWTRCTFDKMYGLSNCYRRWCLG